MKKDYIKLAIAIVILFALAACIGYFTKNDLKLFGHEVKSFSGYSETLSALAGTQNKFGNAADVQKAKLEELETAKKAFEKSKKEYDAISDETINTIKEVTKKEKYSLEYLWTRIGQYARKYKIQIALIEPGSQKAEQAPSTEGKTEGTTPPGATEGATPPAASANGATVQNTTPTETVTNPLENAKPQVENNLSGSYKIDATGDYDKLADFVYAIETDDTLRFKLDNISMQASGNQVKAMFEIKNLDIIK